MNTVWALVLISFTNGYFHTDQLKYLPSQIACIQDVNKLKRTSKLRYNQNAVCLPIQDARIYQRLQRKQHRHESPDIILNFNFNL